MKKFQGGKFCIFYPEERFTSVWESVISLILVFTSLATPVRIAFAEDESTAWEMLNYTVDILFLMDIIIAFNMAFFDEDNILIVERKMIAFHYVRTWFFLDLIAIIPFDLLSSSDK